MTSPGNRARGGAWVAVAGLACLLAGAGSAWAAPPPPGAGDLSPRLAELAKPAVRGLGAQRQNRIVGPVAEGPGSLLRAGHRVLVEARFEGGAAGRAAAVRATGAEVLDVSPRYQTITAAAQPGQLRALGRLAGVSYVSEVLRPITRATCPSGETVTQGFEQLRADDEREISPSVDGSGVTVGILSDSFDAAVESAEGEEVPVATHEAEDIESADLPGAANPCGDTTPTNVLEEFVPEGPEDEAYDEGRAMAQIVHDMAPGAELAFASAFNGMTSFAENIAALVKPEGEGGGGADVLADDVVYFEEPFFQEGPVAVAATEATEGGATYFSAAGNDNLIDSSGRDIGSWETPRFRDSGGCPAPMRAISSEINASHCLDFDPGAGVDTTFGITVEPKSILVVDLQWAEPWEGVGTDLDAALFSSGGTLLTDWTVEGFDDNVASGRPSEVFGWVNPSTSSRLVNLVINRFAGSEPRLKFGLLLNGSGVSATEYPESRGGDVVGPTIFGHSGARAAIGVAAVPYFAGSEPEPYSSRGPVTHYFGPVEGTEAAPPLAAPEIVSKPDLAATDCGRTTFFAFQIDSEPEWHFCGTSAAAPHAAGVAALALDAEPLADNLLVREAEVNSAGAVGSFGSCAVGGGLVDAVATVAAVESGEVGSAPASCEPPPSPPIEEKKPTPVPPVVAPPSPPVPAPPATSIRRHPPKLVRTRGRRAKVVFRFASSEPGSTFRCKIDKGRFRPCPAKLVRRFGLGAHVLRVKARSADGLTDATPAVFRFRVKRLVARRHHRHHTRRRAAQAR